MIVVASELYWPELTSTGRYLTQIAEGLAEDAEVRVLSGQPTYAVRGRLAPRREERNRVTVRRVRSTTLNKNRLLPRLVNALSLSASMFFTGLRSVPRGATILVVTNPPSLPFVMALVALVKRARLVLLIHDVYPDVLVAAGLVRANAPLIGAFDRMSRWLYRRADATIVLGRDMHARVAPRLPQDAPTPVVIPHWMDSEVQPVPRDGNPLLVELGLERHFVAQYAGNMGRSHDLELLTEAAAELGREGGEASAGEVPIGLLLIGWGAKQSRVEAEIRSRELDNVRLIAPRPAAELDTVLGACDVALIAFVPGMAGISVPSRMYNIMAAGRPLIAVADEDSELALVVREEEIGWVVAPGDLGALVRALREARAHPARLAEMGRRARAAALEKYTFRNALPAYRAALRPGA